MSTCAYACLPSTAACSALKPMKQSLHKCGGDAGLPAHGRCPGATGWRSCRSQRSTCAHACPPSSVASLVPVLGRESRAAQHMKSEHTWLTSCAGHRERKVLLCVRSKCMEMCSLAGVCAGKRVCSCRPYQLLTS